MTVLLDPIIRDYMPLKVLDLKTIVEDINGVKRKVTRLTSLCQKADWLNENGRIYSLSVIKEAIAAMQPAINARQVLGEFDHPDDSKIHMDRASHLITKLWMNGKEAYATYEILEDMPCGRMLRALIEQNVQVCVSSRGVGDMETQFNEGREIYQIMPGFRFITIDAVSEPSVVGSKLAVLEGKNRERARKLEIQRQLIKEFKTRFATLV